MANLKSSKKRARQGVKRQLINQSRKSEIKTLTKKLLDAVEAKDLTQAQSLMQTAESKIARAKGKGLFAANTAARKISTLAKKVATLQNT